MSVHISTCGRPWFRFLVSLALLTILPARTWRQLPHYCCTRRPAHALRYKLSTMEASSSEPQVECQPCAPDPVAAASSDEKQKAAAALENMEGMPTTAIVIGMAGSGRGPANVARHIIGCHVNQCARGAVVGTISGAGAGRGPGRGHGRYFFAAHDGAGTEAGGGGGGGGGGGVIRR